MDSEDTLVNPATEESGPDGDANHPPFSLIPFNCQEMSYADYSAAYQTFIKKKIADVVANMHGRGGQW